MRTEAATSLSFLTIPIALLVAIAWTSPALGADGAEAAQEARALSPPAEAASESKPSLAERGEQLLEEIETLGAEYRELKDQSRRADEADTKAVAELQARGRLVDWMRAIDALVDNLVEQEELGQGARLLRQKTRKILLAVNRRIPGFLADVSEENVRLRGRLEGASAEARVAIEGRIHGNDEILDEAVRFYLEHIENLDRLELGSARARVDAAEALEKRAGALAARLEIASGRLDEAVDKNDQTGENEDVVRDAQDQIDRIAASLWTVCDVLDELGLPTAAHRKALIVATGELTTDVLDTAVLAELIEAGIKTSSDWVEQRGPVLVGRLARFFGVLLIFGVLARVTRALTERLTTSPGQQLSMLARRILVTTASRVVLAVGFFIALSQIGVNVTALLAGLGIVGFIVGFALQETLGNFAAGAMILFYDPFDVGDVIEAAGVTGTVDRMNLVSTTILTFDNQMLIVPNSRIWGNVIRNATAMKTRRVDLTFPLALDADVERASQLFAEMCREHPAVLDDPETAIKVLSVSGAGVVVGVRPWVKTEDYWATFWELNRDANARLRAAGIEVAAARYKLEDQKPIAPR